ncbi:MAG: alpha/beta fold hydrolase [Lachnospiraceae bacterium]|nr:alpha/beta fold hydrolase [Lachnospiraceae bacterium]
MREKENKSDSGVKNIPRNPNRKITDQEIDQILKSAAEQVAEKENKVSDKKNSNKQEKRTAETKKHEEEQKVAAKKREDEKRAFEAKKREEERKVAAKKREDEKRTAETRKREEGKKNSEIKKREEERKAAVRKREEEQKNAERRRETVSKSSQDRKGEKRSQTDNFGQLEEEPLVIKAPEVNPYKEKITVGRVIGGFLEFVWTIFKLAVLLTIVTIVAGFLLSRDMMIRGRSGNRQSTEGMVVVSETLSAKSAEEKKVDKWREKVKQEKITMEADDQRILVARKIIVNPDSDCWVVVLHGYNDAMENIYDIAMHYTEQGYNVLMPDLRAHGESEGSFYGMGWLDRLDVINWIDVILKDNPSAQIVIHGVDIGADTALMLSGEPVKNNIKAIVAEGAYTSAWDVVKLEYQTRHPEWPVFPLVHMMNPVMKVWAGYTLTEADAVKQVQKTSIPILLICGGNDTYASEDMMEQLDTAVASPHKVVTIPAGTHGDCRYADADTYYNETFGFVGTYVK